MRNSAVLKALFLFTVLLGAVLVGLVEPLRHLLYAGIREAVKEVEVRVNKKRTVEDVVTIYGATARARLEPHFKKANLSYPPSKLTFVGLKEEKVLIVFADTENGGVKEVLRYPILKASGIAGPKLKEGDCQVPEGFYKIEAFQPNSRYHLALRVSYPNAEDRMHGKDDQRNDLGGDIMIHGDQCSVGCLAMGDPAIEELFVLANDCGRENIAVILAPCDLSKNDMAAAEEQPRWVTGLYERLKRELLSYQP
jgi:Uncharacterized protein conserved in bacteria